ncbi:battenin CLN3 protein [Lecanora helva]
MLPLPGSPASSWVMYQARLRSLFHGADPRVCLAFWLFGLINNVLYVIILSAALDLVGPGVPKGVVLLCDVIPSFLMKLLAPYFIQSVSYSIRVVLLAFISALGMLLIALSPAYTDGGTISTKMAGVVLASLSSGGGELSFISLTHYYGPFSLAAWGSGTGGAGLIGAGAYALATTTLGLRSKTTLLASAFLPTVMLLSFFLILPRGSQVERLRGAAPKDHDSQGPTEEDGVGQHFSNEREGLLQDPEGHSTDNRISKSYTKTNQSWTAIFLQNLRRSRSLFLP